MSRFPRSLLALFANSMNFASFALLSLFLLAACDRQAPATQTASPATTAPPRLVKAMKVGADATASEHRYSGEVRARIETTLGFRVAGKLIERRVDAGARVARGDVLARLDPTDQQLAVTQAQASRALAAAELKRTQELREKNFVSAAALDARQAAAQAAEAQANLAQNQAAYTQLLADASGVVAAVLAEPGQVVGAGQPVFRLARAGEREVAIAIPESRVTALKVGAGATVRLWANAGAATEKLYRGELRELAPAADPATRTFAARVRILDADADVALGMTAAVTFAGSPDGQIAIVVPLAALLQDGERTAVWVIGENGQVSRRPVTVMRYADAGAVLSGGLTAGETIVAAGAFLLVDGEQVRVATGPAVAP